LPIFLPKGKYAWPKSFGKAIENQICGYCPIKSENMERILLAFEGEHEQESSVLVLSYVVES